MNKISPIKERILQYIDYKNIVKQYFCKNTGISYANMKGISLFSEIGGSQLSQILYKYPDLSSEWLITGNGEMLKTNNIESQTPSQIDLSYLIEQLKIKDEQIKAYNEQIKAYNNQIKAKDKQIEKLLGNVDAADAMGAVSRAVAL